MDKEIQEALNQKSAELLFDNDVEDWLLKHQEQNANMLRHAPGTHDTIAIHRIASSSMVQQTAPESTSLSDDDHTVTPQSRVRGFTHRDSSDLKSQLDPLDFTEHLDANVEHVLSIATIAQTLVIEGKTAKERTFCSTVWKMVAFILVIAITIATITSLTVQSGKSPSPVQMSPPTQAPLPSVFNWTISQEISNYATGQLNMFSIVLCKDILIDILNRSDVNFTLFTNAPGMSENLDLAMIAKFVKLPWSGHTLDFILSGAIEGHKLTPDDIYEGLNFTSMAGYRIEFHLNPIRTSRLLFAGPPVYYTNAALWFVTGCPDPNIDWYQRTLYDTLLQANDRRGGDLSIFIALLDKDAELRDLLIDLVGYDDGITIFVPDNDALLNSASSMRNTSNFLRSHLVSGNIATRAWTIIETGTKLNSTHLIVETFTNDVLILDMGQTNITINDEVRIIERDIFAEYGIFHIIDKPLV